MFFAPERERETERVCVCVGNDESVPLKPLVIISSLILGSQYNLYGAPMVVLRYRDLTFCQFFFKREIKKFTEVWTLM